MLLSFDSLTSISVYKCEIVVNDYINTCICLIHLETFPVINYRCRVTFYCSCTPEVVRGCAIVDSYLSFKLIFFQTNGFMTFHAESGSVI